MIKYYKSVCKCGRVEMGTLKQLTALQDTHDMKTHMKGWNVTSDWCEPIPISHLEFRVKTVLSVPRYQKQKKQHYDKLRAQFRKFRPDLLPP